MKQVKIIKVWVDSDYVYAESEHGVRASYAFVNWPRLADATPEQRLDFQLSCFGIHWPQIDEDLSFEGMFRDQHLLANNEEILMYVQ